MQENTEICGDQGGASPALPMDQQAELMSETANQVE